MSMKLRRERSTHDAIQILEMAILRTRFWHFRSRNILGNACRYLEESVKLKNPYTADEYELKVQGRLFYD